jgi:hypothetical protein
MTYLAMPQSGAEVPDGYAPAVPGTVDQAIRISTALAVLAVAGIAAYVSYWHAYAVVCAHGETGVTARLEPATIDGLVYASSMVNLYAARHRLPVPVLARWLLGLGIAATLAANVAQGWSHGLVGAAVAAWPAVSLVGSYELLVWIVRTATETGPDRGPIADEACHYVDQADVDPRFEAGAMSGGRQRVGAGPTRVGHGGPQLLDHVVQADQESGPAPEAVDREADRLRTVSEAEDMSREDATNAAAAAAYRASVEAGKPLSERKLAARFDRTSRRWARNRIAEARHTPATV